MIILKLRLCLPTFLRNYREKNTFVSIDAIVIIVNGVKCMYTIVIIVNGVTITFVFAILLLDIMKDIFDESNDYYDINKVYIYII